MKRVRKPRPLGPARPWVVRAADQKSRLEIKRSDIDFDEFYVGDPTWFGMERMDERSWCVWIGEVIFSVTIPANGEPVQVLVYEGGEKLGR